MNTFEIRNMPIDQLQPAPYNPRKVLKPSSKAYKKLRASISEFGLVEPLIWNELSGYVVGGHARLRILVDLGVTEVPVSVVRLSDEREKALNVMLNNQEAQSRYDTAKLASVLEELQGADALDMSGFDLSMLETLKMEPLEELPKEPKSDRVEVTIVTTAEKFDVLSPKLDKLVRQFDLETHVRAG